MKPAVIYHWWAEERDNPLNANLRIPLILSIATLRGADPSLPIYVLNGSEQPVDWFDFPERLNFKVIPYTFWLQEYKHRAGWNLLSRLNDVNDFSLTINEDLIFYSDCDVFWLKSPLPIEQNPNRFCFDRYNSGFFYFDKKQRQVQRFFELFKAYTLTALNDENFRVITRQYAGEDSWTFVLDETVMYYMSCKMNDLYNYVGPNEHLAPWTDSEIMRTLDFNTVKMMHIHGTYVQNKFETDPEKRQHARGIACLAIKEFYQNLCKCLTRSDLEKFYGPALDYYLERQVSLYDKAFIERWLQSKKSKGDLYQFNEAIRA